MPARKRKVNYPPAKTSTRPTRGEPVGNPVRQGVVTIDLNAGAGRPGLSVGDRVRISGSGLYAGEEAVIERTVNGAIPAAFVRTIAGRARQVRAIDLEPITSES